MLCCNQPRVTLLSKAFALALTSVMFSPTYMLDSASGLGIEDFTESLVATRENVCCASSPHAPYTSTTIGTHTQLSSVHFWSHIGLEGNSGVKRTGSNNNISPTNIMSYKWAKYRTITFSLIIRPLFPSFLHHHCLQILYATNILIENVFITCFICHFNFFMR